jgi:hypothetical protein
VHSDSASVEYHRWLTPEQIGARFGLAHEDLDVIQRWLESRGFSINTPYRTANAILRTCAIHKSRPLSRRPFKASHPCTIFSRGRTPFNSGP